MHGLARGTFSFVEWLEAPDGVARVALEWQGGTSERRPSAAAPSLAITSPSPGAALDGAFTLAWRAEDPDGDPLTFDVLASRDDGRSWRVLARHLTGSSVRLHTERLAGGDRVRLRVRASDGFHTAQADAGPLRVPDAPPLLVLVTSPVDGASFPRRALVVLTARASDLEDGLVATYAWSSDLDGALGTGAELHTRALSPGTHRITVRATDRGGTTREASVRVEVDGSRTADAPGDATLARLDRVLRDHRDPDGRGGGATGVTVAGLGAAAILGALAALRRVRGRRGQPAP